MEILGIDIGGTGMKAAPVDLDTGQLTADRHRIPTPKPATPEAVAGVVKQLVDHFEWDGPIGSALPARVKKGVAKTASNIEQAWIGTNADALFEQVTGCPAVVLNDADAAGVAEMAYGAGKGREDLVLLLTFGTGIGSALFYKGRLIPNTEFGHLRYRKKRVFEDYAADSVRKKKGLSWTKWASRAQVYLDHVEFLLAPDLIIIGGGVSRPAKLAEYFHLLSTEADLEPAQLENEAGIVGAACAARELISA